VRYDVISSRFCTEFKIKAVIVLHIVRGEKINMIPKIIHYCWFGNGEKPELAKKCIESWKKYCSDYELMEWNEQNFDISSAPLYVRQAYENKKWAFITDYVRLYAMVNYGGVYMDTDVEVIKPIDEFLNNRAFSGFEDGKNILTAVMACEKGFPLFKEMMRVYDNAVFLREDGSLDTTTNVVRLTNICLSNGLVQNNEKQVIKGLAVYPKDYFCPVEYLSGKMKKTENTVAIHWFLESWFSDEQKQEIKKWRKRRRFDYIVHTPNRILIKVMGQEKYENFKNKVKK